MAGLLLMLLLLLPAPAVHAAADELAAEKPTVCAPIREAQVAELFERWNGALASGDPDQVVALYSSDALLLPTLSAEPRSGAAAIRAYFVDFLARSPEGRIDSRTVQVACNSAFDAGTYSFRVRDPSDPGAAPQWVSARYSFIYAPQDGQWRIVHHHSSLVPG